MHFFSKTIWLTSFLVTSFVLTVPAMAAAPLETHIRFSGVQATPNSKTPGYTDVTFILEAPGGSQTGMVYGFEARDRNTESLLFAQSLGGEILSLVERRSATRSFSLPPLPFLPREAAFSLVAYNERGVLLARENVAREPSAGTVSNIACRLTEDRQIACTNRGQTAAQAKIAVRADGPFGYPLRERVLSLSAGFDGVLAPLTAIAPISFISPGQYTLTILVSDPEKGIPVGFSASEFVEPGTRSRLLNVVTRASAEAVAIDVRADLDPLNHASVRIQSSCNARGEASFTAEGTASLTLPLSPDCPNGTVEAVLFQDNAARDRLSSFFEKPPYSPQSDAASPLSTMTGKQWLLGVMGGVVLVALTISTLVFMRRRQSF